MLKCQNVARDKLFNATFIGIEWFRKATIALRHHIYKRLKPHTDKKKEKKVRSDDIIMLIRHTPVKHIYIIRKGIIHLYMEETIGYTPPPPISFYGSTTDLLKAKSYTILINI